MKATVFDLGGSDALKPYIGCYIPSAKLILIIFDLASNI